MNIYFEKLYLSIQASPPEDLPPHPEAKSGGATPPPKKQAADGTWNTPSPQRAMDEDSDPEAAPSPTTAPGSPQYERSPLPPPPAAVAHGSVRSFELGASGNTSYAPAKKQRQNTPNVPDQEHVTNLRPLGWEHGAKLEFEKFNEQVFSITISDDDPSSASPQGSKLRQRSKSLANPENKFPPLG